MGKEYTCAHCGGTFEAGWSDEEARAEFEKNWPGEPFDPDLPQVCDDCYRMMVAADPPPGEGE